MAKPYRFGVEPITCHAWNKDQTSMYLCSIYTTMGYPMGEKGGGALEVLWLFTPITFALCNFAKLISGVMYQYSFWFSLFAKI